MTADVSWLYWTDKDAGVVMRRAHSGGPAIELVDAQPKPGLPLVDACNVYWFNAGDGGAIMRVSKKGGAPAFVVRTMLSNGNINDFDVDDTHVYFRKQDDPAVWMVPKAGGEPTIAYQPRPHTVWGLVVDSRHLYFSLYMTRLGVPIARVSKGATSTDYEKIGSASGTPSMYDDSDFVYSYWSPSGDAWMIGKGDKASRVLKIRPPYASDDKYVYGFAESGSGKGIHAVPKCHSIVSAPGAIPTIAPPTNSPVISAGGGFVYYQTPNEIRRVSALGPQTNTVPGSCP